MGPLLPITPAAALLRGRLPARASGASPAGHRPQRWGTAAVLLAAVLWGTAGPASALEAAAPSPAHAAALRSLVGAAGLAAAAVALGQGAALAGLLGPARWRWLLAAAGAVALFQVAFFTGVDRIGVALGTVVALGSAPIVGGLISAARARVPPGGRWLLATTLAIGGIAVLLRPDGSAPVDALGVALAVVAGSAFAGYTVAASVRSERGDPALATTAAAFLASVVLLAPLLAAGDRAWLGEPAGVAVALWLGLATAAVPYALYAWGLRSVAAHRALTLSLADPLTAAVLGVLVLGEALTAIGGLGLLLVVSGLLIAVSPGGAPPAEPTAISSGAPSTEPTVAAPSAGQPGRTAPTSALLRHTGSSMT